MNKIKLSILILSITFTNHAFSENEYYFLNEKGIKIINDLGSKNLKFSNDNISLNQENENNSYIDYMMNIPHQAKIDFANTKIKNDLYDTSLKSSTYDMKLNFNLNMKSFNKNKLLNQENIIAFTPFGTWENGWDGIKIFFYNPFNQENICSYSVTNIIAITMMDKNIKYINGHPARIFQNKSKNGSVLEIKWYKELKDEKVLMQHLECVSKVIFKEDEIKQLINFSETIDKQSLYNMKETI